MIFGHKSLGEAMEELQAAGRGEKKKTEKKTERKAEVQKLELMEDREEKPNLLAVFLAAMIVVLPVLLLAAGLMLLALWLFLGGF